MPPLPGFGRHIACRGRQRSFSTSASQLRDLLAQYRPMVTPSDILFETTASVPVSPSLQEVPAPDKFPSDGNRAEDSAAATSSRSSPSVPSFPTSETPVTGAARTATPLPAMLPVASDEAKLRPYAAGSLAQGMDVQGVWVPPKPVPPGEEECCMSGCVNCVYNLYADDTLAYNDALSSALSALQSAHVPIVKWPPAISALHRKQDTKQGRGSGMSAQALAEEQARDQVEETMQDIDPALKAFLELEGKLRSKQRA